MKKVQKDNDSWFCYTVEFQNQGLITWHYHMALSHGLITWHYPNCLFIKVVNLSE